VSVLVERTTVHRLSWLLQLMSRLTPKQISFADELFVVQHRASSSAVICEKHRFLVSRLRRASQLLMEA